jgi:hypothetical protein
VEERATDVVTSVAELFDCSLPILTTRKGSTWVAVVLAYIGYCDATTLEVMPQRILSLYQMFRRTHDHAQYDRIYPEFALDSGKGFSTQVSVIEFRWLPQLF